MTFYEFPRSVQFVDLCKFAKFIDEAPEVPKIHFKTGHVRFFTPTSMTFIAKVCGTRNRKYPNEKMFFHGLDNHHYANNLGFSAALNLKGAPYPQGAYGGKSYLPMSAMRRQELKHMELMQNIALGDAIQIKCNEMAQVISQRKSAKLEGLLANSFREIFRNVFEHSGSESAVYCSQYWDGRDAVEICIADRGIGFSKSLAEDDRFKGLSDRSALLYSLMPGVSSKAKKFKNKRSSLKSDWDNSGFGLFFVHRLFGKFGWFGLASCSHALIVEQGAKKIRTGPTSVEGSLVSMRLELSDIEAIEREIDLINKEAFSIKEKMGVNGLKLSSIEAFLGSGT